MEQQFKAEMHKRALLKHRKSLFALPTKTQPFEPPPEPKPAPQEEQKA